MRRNPPRREPGQRARVFALLFSMGTAALLAAGCPTGGVIPEPPEPGPTQVIEKGQSVVAEFPADGKWHPSGFVGRPGDRIRFVPLDEAAYLSKQAILTHIGRTRPQLVYPGKSVQRIATYGEIHFRVDPDYLGPYQAKAVRIKIECLAE